MKIFVDTSKLTDSPYNGSGSYPFIFDQAIINDVVEDIKFGNPTCYLVSGYRGAGKSSFIKKVEHTIGDDQKIIFVHSSFAKYESHTYLLRKLIRGLYQTFIQEQNSKSLIDLKKAEDDANELNEQRTSRLLETLYEKTFNEITNNTTAQIKDERETQFTLDHILFIGFLLVFLLSLSNLIYPWLSNSLSISIIALIGSTIGVVKEFFSLKSTLTKTESNTEEFQRKSLYDDEISDYHFNNLINGLAKKSFKVVFVLDELDKVKEEEVNTLINEMKPYLVSGVASFIVVAGQELFYKYQSSESIDDAILSTLFSRVIHVPLLSIPELTTLFLKLLSEENKLPSDFASQCQPFIDYLIFKSKRIPRKFINLIRQNISWENGKGYLDIDLDTQEFKIYSNAISSIQRVDEQIAINFDDGSRDYLTMQLFIQVEKIVNMPKNNWIFDKDELIKKLN